MVKPIDPDLIVELLADRGARRLRLQDPLLAQASAPSL
jgi:hypothetical protein